MTDGTSIPEGFTLHRCQTIGSTNDEARRLARGGAPEGTVVWALEQKAGRGRRGRLWQSPPGNLYFSIVLRPHTPAASAPQLGFVAAVALAAALDRLAGSRLELRFKWPNDVLVGGKKLAGILLESEMAASDQIDFIILGIGVNIIWAPHDLQYPATSLADEGVSGVSPATLLEALTAEFVRWADRWRARGFAPVRRAWLDRADGLGEAVRVCLEYRTLDGRFRDLDHDGALVLEANGGERRITAGEVFPALS